MWEVGKIDPKARARRLSHPQGEKRKKEEKIKKVKNLEKKLEFKIIQIWMKIQKYSKSGEKFKKWRIGSSAEKGRNSN